MSFLYSALLAAFLLLTLPYWLLQMLRHGKYREGLAQRFGNVPPHILNTTGDPVIWIHAVSVGEVVATSGVIEKLRGEKFPSHRVLISTTTRTGQKLAAKRFGVENVFYFPLDFAFAIHPYLRALKPDLVIIAETELWPNFLRLTKQSGARIAIINCRISDHSLPGYQRLRLWLPHLLKTTLHSVDIFLAQSDQDQRRLIELGAPAEKTLIAGNLKFDVGTPPSPPIVSSLRESFVQSNAGPILVCGSTLEDEESPLLSAFRNILGNHPKAVMILAPRHTERFSEVASLIEKLGFRLWRRSLWSGESLAGGVLLVDGIGELAALYSLATVAFVGGSLVPRGGHNILEPALYGVAIVTGNHYENFRDIVNFFLNRNAVRVVGLSELPLVFMDLIENPQERATIGRNALEALQSQRGATEKTISALVELMNREPEKQPPARHGQSVQNGGPA